MWLVVLIKLLVSFSLWCYINEHKGWFSISELSFTGGHLISHCESLLGLQNTGLFMIVKLKILWYYELTIPCVVFEKSINVCLFSIKSRPIDFHRFSILIDNL